MLLNAPNPHHDLAGFRAMVDDVMHTAAAARFPARVRYPFEAPFLFDFRWDNEARRMGIGDVLVVTGALQAIGRATDSKVSVILSEGGALLELWMASGLHVITVPESFDADTVRSLAAGLPVRTFISHRHHFLENPADTGGVCDYGERAGYPGYQFLWNHGWEDQVDLLPVRIDLWGTSADQQSARCAIARALLDFHLPRNPTLVVTCNPLEITRGNEVNTPARWLSECDRIITQAARDRRGVLFLFGCAPHEVERMKPFIPDAPHAVATLPLLTWYETIRSADVHLTTNTAGLWLGFASCTPLVVLSASATKHGAMWEPKPNWSSPPLLHHVA